MLSDGVAVGDGVVRPVSQRQHAQDAGGEVTDGRRGGTHAEASDCIDDIAGAEGPGDWLLVPTRANGQPATANYLRQPADSDHHALSIDVLTVHDDRLVAVNCFLGDQLFPAFGSPQQSRAAEATA